MIIPLGQRIKFRYKGRKVKLELTFYDDKILCGLLLSDYIGKNKEWYKGEVKKFNLKEIKNIITRGV